MTDSSLRNRLTASIDTIESAYEFLLAYAAQGRHTDRGAAAGQSPRDRLAAMADAMTKLPAIARELAGSKATAGASDYEAFLDALERDAATSVAGVRLVLSVPDISSQIVDNLNASIHVRALLTDMFLIDEALKG
ncbi:MAG TPA: hypothetical protein VIV64_08975 [Gammaproteobacteria bacterium]|jgi:hypothetical protein